MEGTSFIDKPAMHPARTKELEHMRLLFATSCNCPGVDMLPAHAAPSDLLASFGSKPAMASKGRQALSALCLLLHIASGLDQLPAA